MRSAGLLAAAFNLLTAPTFRTVGVREWRPGDMVAAEDLAAARSRLAERGNDVMRAYWERRPKVRGGDLDRMAKAEATRKRERRAEHMHRIVLAGGALGL